MIPCGFCPVVNILKYKICYRFAGRHHGGDRFASFYMAVENRQACRSRGLPQCGLKLTCRVKVVTLYAGYYLGKLDEVRP